MEARGETDRGPQSLAECLPDLRDELGPRSEKIFWGILWRWNTWRTNRLVVPRADGCLVTQLNSFTEAIDNGEYDSVTFWGRQTRDKVDWDVGPRKTGDEQIMKEISRNTVGGLATGIDRAGCEEFLGVRHHQRPPEMLLNEGEGRRIPGWQATLEAWPLTGTADRRFCETNRQLDGQPSGTGTSRRASWTFCFTLQWAAPTTQVVVMIFSGSTSSENIFEPKCIREPGQ